MLHYPGKEKKEDFSKTLKMKLDANDLNFPGVCFPDEAMFRGFQFTAAVDFSSAWFHERVDFSFATFHGKADFSSATFSGDADFDGATFSSEFKIQGSEQALAKEPEKTVPFLLAKGKETNPERSLEILRRDIAKGNVALARLLLSSKLKADFSSASFKGKGDFSSSAFSAAADFGNATFAVEADFRFATFEASASFTSAIFLDVVRFAGTDDQPQFNEPALVDFQLARMEKPEHTSFQSVSLIPQWFLNVDIRKFNFANVTWPVSLSEGEILRIQLKEQYDPERIRARTGGSLMVFQMLETTCRHLAVNAEENDRYEEASRFRYMAMDVRRLGQKLRGSFPPSRLIWWYWLASGYGERAPRAALTLVSLWILFAFAFFIGQRNGQWWRLPQQGVQETRLVRNETPRSLNFREALIYSAGVMTLQKPEPTPANNRAKTVVLFATVLGPLQAGLLVLAIRRKFMR